MTGFNKVTITAIDGKVFIGTINNYDALLNEFNAYEANVKLKKQQEQEERAKAVAKAEADRKTKEEAREKAKKRVDECVNLINQAVERYESEVGEKLEFVTINGKLTVQKLTQYDQNIFNIRLLNANPWWSGLYEELRHNI